MPTENERKYLLDSNCESDVHKLSIEQMDIAQGYLIATRGITVRVRKAARRSNSKTNYYFTLKVNTAGRVIEIEQDLDERDFRNLWDIALNKLEKVRYIVKNKKDVWEMDFFKDYKNETYMAVAEIELPEGKEGPDTLPNIVKDNIIYEVPLTDNRFSNKLLGDARYAAELFQEIKENKR